MTYRQAGHHLREQVVNADLAVSGPIRRAEYTEARHAINDSFRGEPQLLLPHSEGGNRWATGKRGGQNWSRVPELRKGVHQRLEAGHQLLHYTPRVWSLHSRGVENITWCHNCILFLFWRLRKGNFHRIHALLQKLRRLFLPTSDQALCGPQSVVERLKVFETKTPPKLQCWSNNLDWPSQYLQAWDSLWRQELGFILSDCVPLGTLWAQRSLTGYWLLVCDRDLTCFSCSVLSTVCRMSRSSVSSFASPVVVAVAGPSFTVSVGTSFAPSRTVCPSAAFAADCLASSLASWAFAASTAFSLTAANSCCHLTCQLISMLHCHTFVWHRKYPVTLRQLSLLHSGYSKGCIQ